MNQKQHGTENWNEPDPDIEQQRHDVNQEILDSLKTGQNTNTTNSEVNLKNEQQKIYEEVSSELQEVLKTGQNAQNANSEINLTNAINQDFLKSETHRRWLFDIVVIFGVLIVTFLYLILALWLLLNLKNTSNNVWHIATILALPPTTILFLLIKVLAKSPNNTNSTKDDKQAITPAGEALEKSGELAEKCLDMLKTLLNKK